MLNLNLNLNFPVGGGGAGRAGEFPLSVGGLKLIYLIFYTVKIGNQLPLTDSSSVGTM